MVDLIDERDIPTAHRHLLWSYQPDHAGRYPIQVVISRLMDRGDLAAIRWLLHHFGRARLRRTLPAISRQLGPRSLALWNCLLETDVRQPEMIPWIAE